MCSVSTDLLYSVMEHIREKLNSDYKFRTLTADDGYIIANVLYGFDADYYIGTKTMVLLPLENQYLLIAILGLMKVI